MESITTLQRIDSVLQAGLQGGQFVLGRDSFEDFDLTGLLGLLNTSQVVITDATITALDRVITLSGKARIFGADPIGLDLTFTANGEAIDLAFTAAAPVGQIPGIPWLPLANLQVALAVTANGVTGTLSAAILPSSGDAIAITLTLATGETVHWQSELQALSLSTVASLFLNTRSGPQDLPDVVFSTLALSLTPSTGEFSLRAIADSEWAFASQTLGIQADLSIDRLSTMINAGLTVQGAGPLAIAEGLSLQNLEFAFTLEAGDWQLAGGVTATLFDETLNLTASYAQMADRRLLMLSGAIADTLSLITLPEVGALGITRFDLALAQSTGAGEPTDWSLAATGGLMFTGVADLQGRLTLSQEGNIRRVVFVPEAAAVRLPLSPGQELRLSFGEIAIVQQALPGTTVAPGSAWRFEADIALAIAGLHPTVYRVLPRQFNAQFRADGDRLMITADRVVNAADFALPNIDINDLSVPLGTVRIDVVNLAIRVDTEVTLSADLALGLPSELNNLLGVDESGEPLLELFNTFDPENPAETTVNLRLAIAPTGISITPVTSPIRAVRIEEDNGIAYWHVDLGAFGEVRLQLPILTYDVAQSSFTSSGGLEVIRPLSLPLTPFKRLLEATGLGDLAATIPDGLPLQDIQILDDNDTFHTEELLDLLSLAGDVPAELEQAIALVGDRFDQLPDQFRAYLNVEIPDSFFYDIAITPDGTAKLNAHVNDGDPPVRLLFSAPIANPLLPVPVPALNGIELRSLSFGELSGGSLFLLEVDANLDQFDLISLAASLALPNEGFLPFPDTRDFQRRIVLRNLFMLIVYQTVIPIPVPLFYDEVGIEYLNLEGVTLQTHAQFPMPSLNLSEIGEIVSDLGRFFSDREFLLDPNMPPDDVNLSFSLDQNYLRLPQYLGSAMLGPGMNGPEINAYAALAHLLNGLKTFSINELIQAMPLEYRVSGIEAATPERISAGPIDVSFVGLRAQMGWLVTTPGEYQQLIANPTTQAQLFEQLQLADEAAAHDLLAILPAASEETDSTTEEGLVSFLKGRWAITDVAELEAAFGLVASGVQGFRTGFRIAGEIENVIDLELGGRVAIAAAPAGNPLPPAEERRYGLAFDGQNDHVQLGNPAALNFAGPITLEAWVRPEATDGFRNILAHGHRFSPNGEVFLRINSGRYEVGSWDGTAYLTAAPMPAADLDTWVHLAGVYDGQAWRLYRNGELLSMTTAARGAIAVNETWAIGARGTGTERFFQGHIDEVRIWNRARTQVEIQSDRFQTLRGSEPGLTGYWRFDEGTGTVAQDLSPHGHTGIVNGAGWVADGAPLVFANPDAPVSNSAFQLAGHSHLSVLNHPVFTGDVQATADSFWLRGDLDLFPETFPAQANGRLSGRLNDAGLQLSGSATAAIAGITLADARASVTNGQIFLQGTWLGVTPTLALTVQNDAFALNGSLSVDVPLDVTIGPIHEPTTGVRLVDSLRLNTRVATNIAVSVTQSGFAAQVSGRFQWNNRTWQVPEFTVTVAFQDVEALARLIREQIQAQAAAIFAALLGNAVQWLLAVRNGVIQFAGDVAAGLRDAYRLTAQVAASTLRNAGYAVQQIGAALQGAYRQTAQQAAQILNGLRYGVEDVGAILRDLFGTSAAEAARIFRALNFPAGDVGQLLNRVFGLRLSDVIPVMADLGYSAVAVGQALRQAFNVQARIVAENLLTSGRYAANAVAGALNTVFRLSADNAAATLASVTARFRVNANGFPERVLLTATEVGSALRLGYNLDARSVARALLRITRFSEDQVTAAIRGAFGATARDAGRIVNDAVDELEDLGGTIIGGFDRIF